MKRNNNSRFRGNTIYSLNYKFDSVSAAGKFSGTALELIKKYNELAKEAHSNGNYVEMEVFRQYAEHYRKIVTEINERKTQMYENQNESQPAAGTEERQQTAESSETVVTEQSSDKKPETAATDTETPSAAEQPAENISTAQSHTRRRRAFTVVEVADKAKESSEEETSKPRRRRVLRKPAAEA